MAVWLLDFTMLVAKTSENFNQESHDPSNTWIKVSCATQQGGPTQQGGGGVGGWMEECATGDTELR